MAQQLFLGEDLLPWLVLAFGGALVVGNLLAWVRPPKDALPNERLALSRVLAMVAVGSLACVWALASLVS